MTPRRSTIPRSTKKIALAVTGVIVVVATGYVTRQAIHGHGRFHALASDLYHRFRSGSVNSAYAAEIAPERADAPLTIFDDKPASGWVDWSWATHDLKSHSPAHGGSYAIVMSPKGNQGVYLHHDPISVSGYGSLQFYVYGSSKIKVSTVGGDYKFNPAVKLAAYRKGTSDNGWALVSIPLDALGSGRSSAITGIVFQADGAELQPPIVFDDISLMPDTSLPASPTQWNVKVTVDPGSDRHGISPYIYGMAFAPKDYLSDLRISVNRWGGNDKSRYNWVQGNADNAARDWRFANRTAYGSAPNGRPSSAADDFIRTNEDNGTQSLITVPTIGWVARNADNKTASQDVPKSGGAPLAGADGGIRGYDPAANRRLTSVRSLPRKGGPFTDSPSPSSDPVYQDEWIAHLTKKFGPANAGGVKLYAMDNEPDLWDSTHTDVHPARLGYDDILRNFLDYATAVKAVDPAAQITGPVSWGWTGYQYSPLDRGDDNFHEHADQNRHNGEWLLPWFLKKVHEHDFKTGKRSLDVLDVHYYPQGQGLYSSQADKDTRARRLRSTRSLWDPAYIDESWIGEPVRLIPRMKEWIGQSYPGTKIGITEWNFGAEKDASGGLAVADVLGIFGREGVDLANYWAYPPKDSPAYLAFKLYRNADGHGGGFGNGSCKAVSADPNRLSAYAATDSTGDLTVVLINKMPAATMTVPLTIKGLEAGRQVRAYRYASGGPSGIERLPVETAKGQEITEILPPYSMTLLRIAKPQGGGQ